MHNAKERKWELIQNKGMGALVALVTAIGWGIVCGVLRTSYGAVAVGGIGLAALGFWLERATLFGLETMARKDLYLIAFAGFGFFAVVGVGVVSFSALIATWYLPSI